MNTVGIGIHKTTGRHVKVMADKTGGYWICDPDVDVDGDFASQGCVPHRDLHR